MKCLILAAGYATRLYPLTENFPKPLLKIGDKTILDWLIDDIDGSGLVDGYVVISNHKFARHFEEWAARKSVDITVVDDGTSTNETRLGAVRDIQFAIDRLGLDDDMLVIAGDNVLDFSLTKFLDLDRCYSVSRIPTSNGKELCVYNLHLSAYSADGTIADDQMELLIADMQAEYEKGNYVIGGGDFNKDLLGDSSKYFGVSTAGYTWSQPIRMDLIEASDIKLVAPLDEENPVASCRNADGPIREGQLRLTVDGFLASPNVKVEGAKVIDLEFAYSDHNPVEMHITLEP